MKKADSSNGFLLCFFMNLMLNIFWGAAAAVLAVLHFWLSLPLFLSLGALGIWLLEGLFLTLLVFWGNKAGNERDEVRENINPYSHKNDDYLPKK